MDNLDLMYLTAEALHERAAYILEHADSIYVRVEIGGRWDNWPLSAIPPKKMLEEAFRLLLRFEVPHGKLKPEASDARS